MLISHKSKTNNINDVLQLTPTHGSADQQSLEYISPVWTLMTVSRTYQVQWMIGTDRESERVCVRERERERERESQGNHCDQKLDDYCSIQHL